MDLLENVKNLTKLTEASVLARTRASDLENVRKLNCWASQIGDASIVRRMPNLEVCSLSVNNLNSLEDFSYCPNLQELYIRKNNVENLRDIHYLKNLERLRVLWLSDNPCSQRENYRLTVLRTLPNLQKLDNIVVTEDELNRALEEGGDLSPPDGFEFHKFASLARANQNVNTNSSNCSSSIDPSSEDADFLEEGECEVEPLASYLSPVASEREPVSAIRSAELQRKLLRQNQEAIHLSWAETNQIRAQLGLKPLPISKVTVNKPLTTGVTKARNANILQAVLLLLRELDKDSLEIVHNVVQKKLEDM